MSFRTEILMCFILAICVGVIGGTARASTDIGELLTEIQYQYNPPEFTVCAEGTVECREVASRDEFTIIHADGGSRCPAGYYFIANKKKSIIEPVIAPTCDPSLKIGFAPSGRLIELAMFGKVAGTVPLDR